MALRSPSAGKRAGAARGAARSARGSSRAERPVLRARELQGALGFRLREAWSAMERYFLACFREENATPAPYAVALLVAENPGCLASDICAVTSITTANIIPYIDELVERGMIRREIGSKDRRAKHLHLTQEGLRRLDAWRRLEQQVVAHFRKRIGTQNLPQLIEWLAAISGSE